VIRRELDQHRLQAAVTQQELDGMNARLNEVRCDTVISFRLASILCRMFSSSTSSSVTLESRSILGTHSVVLRVCWSKPYSLT
jgi:hypothetical protein